MHVCRIMHIMQRMGLTASVLGASGYSGGELLRLLARHPAIAVTAAGAQRAAGRSVADLHPHLPGPSDFVTLEDAAATEADVCFSCLPSGELSPRLPGVRAARVVDLSDEHRADGAWTYGLTEHHRDRVATAERVANPGCYPTATLLALVPFARAELIESPVVVDALSGTSGAGRGASDHLMHSALHGGAGAYGHIPHRHVAEMERELALPGVSFTPHLVPMARGLLVTARARLTETLTDKEATSVLRDAYDGEPFVSVIDSWPQTKAVAGSNHAHVAAHVDSGWVVASAAIDNLGKGAAGQALQNANLMLGLDEVTGLEGLGVWP